MIFQFEYFKLIREEENEGSKKCTIPSWIFTVIRQSQKRFKFCQFFSAFALRRFCTRTNRYFTVQ